MLGISCYLEENNVILPFYTVAVAIPNESKLIVEELISKVNVDTISLTRSLSLLNKLKPLNIKPIVQELGKFEIEKYGINSAYFRSVRYLSNLDFEVTLDSISLEVQLAFLWSRLLRTYKLNYYSQHYKELDISKHKGALNDYHLQILSDLNVLPYFYNESLLINYCLTNNLMFPWVVNYIKQRYDIIE